ncbi:RIB43A-like with coiled-coils protein 2 [Gadus morhua]|uniref:RIB43A-like with coiled-coils protein 2 n=1 Tax=Gadus morhua TaxID=8049 RepID=UPI0011B7FAB5|nr:RIB43A-like with coiled-coils protein 2 [Gadus morhua]
MNIELLSDRLAAANLATHQNRELHRQERIFNSKVRTLGVDQIGFQHQVKENEKKGESAKDSSHAFAADMLQNDKAACILDGRQRKEERLLEQALDDYRRCYQQPQHRREQDLSHPEPMAAPGTAGLQKTLPGLLGEDPGSGERLQRQKEQLRGWSQQQQQELEAARHQQKRADELYNQSRISVDSKALQLQEVEQATRKALAHADKDFNLAKAAENRETHRRAREKTEEDKHQADVLMLLQADREMEASQETALQAFRQRIHFNLHQVEEKTRTRWEKQQKEQREEQLRVDLARSAVLLERQQSRTHRMQRQELDQTNAQLAQAQRQQKKALEKECFGDFDDSYFSKFNTSSR